MTCRLTLKFMEVRTNLAILRRMSFKSLPYRRCFGAAGAAFLVAMALVSGAQAQKLVVYSSADADALEVFAKAFAKAHPKVAVEWVRASTGALQKRILEEREELKADVIFAHTAANMIELDKLGLLQPLAPQGLERVGGRYLDIQDPPRWIGLYTWSTAMCWNTPGAAKSKLARPRTWQDLLNPALKGRVVMPDPVYSGTGAMMVTGWVRTMGEAKAWAYMDKLHQQVSQYTRSGTKPCEMAAAGGTQVGLSFPGRGARIKDGGGTIDVLIPEDGTAWDLQAVAVNRKTRKPADAMKLVEWALSTPAMEEFARYGEVTSVKVRVQKLSHLPPNIPERMIAQDFDWLSNQRVRILAEWQKRYAGKTEPAP